MTNPLATLGLSRRDADALNKLPIQQRRVSLNLLRRYYANTLHPDKTGDPGDGRFFADINSALDDLATGNFGKYYNEYTQVGTTESGGYLERMKEQAEWWKGKATQAESNYKKLIEQRDKKLEEQQALISKLRTNLYSYQKRFEDPLWINLQKVKEELRRTKRSAEEDLRTLQKGIIAMIRNIGLDQRGRALSQLKGMKIIRRVDYLTVDENLSVTRYPKRSKMIKGRGRPSYWKGRLVGGIGILEAADLGITNGMVFTIGSAAGSRLLSHVKPWLDVEMYVVTEKRGSELHIFRPGNSIEPYEEIDVAPIIQDGGEDAGAGVQSEA